jgi:hypothetical protein
VTIQNPATNISLEFFHFILNPEQRWVFQLVVNKYSLHIYIGYIYYSILIINIRLAVMNLFRSTYPVVCLIAGIMVVVLAIRPRDRGFKPCRE